jgi:putative endonuclease
MASESCALYIGMTNYLNRRVAEHKREQVSGLTAKYNIKKLVYFEGYSEVRSAISREKQLKGSLRAKKIALIKRKNPMWRDLSDDFAR